MRNVILCDIDGTIADLSHRLHFIKNGNKDWDNFFNSCDKDVPILPVVDLIQNFNYDTVFVTGRPEKLRQKTYEWLYKKTGIPVYSDSLYMRKDGDHRPDAVVKAEILEEIMKTGNNILFVIDDRPSVISMWREKGLFVFQVGSHWENEEITETRGSLTLMVGPTGAGKSTWLKSEGNLLNYVISPAEIISSDQVREDLFGNFLDQSDNARVFSIVYRLAKARINVGLNATIDATNLRRADRRAAVDFIKPRSVRYIVIDRPLQDKLDTVGWRAQFPGLIEKHHQRFQSGLGYILTGDDIGAKVIDLRKGV